MTEPGGEGGEAPGAGPARSGATPPPPSRAARWVRRLLRAHSPSFRARYGPGVEYSLLSDHAEAVRSGGFAVFRFWVRTAASIVTHGALEQLESWRVGGATSRRGVGEGVTGVERRKGMGTRVEQVAREVRFALRRLAKQPLFTLTAAGTLGLGLGATTAIFIVIDAVLLRPLPYPDEDRVVLVGHRSEAGSRGMPDGGYLYYAEYSETLDRVAAYSESTSTIGGTGEPLELGIVSATPSLFPTMGVSPFLGRGFTEEDAAAAATPVAVVSHDFWVRHLGADSAALGRNVLSDVSIPVVGVMPAGFDFPRPEATIVFGNRFEGPDIYLPMGVDPSIARFGNFRFQSIGRLAPGATPEDAQEELDRLMLRAAEAYPGTAEGPGFRPDELVAGSWRSRVLTVREATVGPIGRVLWILLAAVGVLLLIALANVANLFLVRAEARRGEIALQRALGADRAALLRTALSESVLLTAAGAVAGVALARLAVPVVIRWAPRDIPGLDAVGLGGWSIVFALGVSLLTGLALGTVALGRTRGSELGPALDGGSRGRTVGRERRRLQDALVTVQVGLALMLVVGSALLLRSFDNLRSVEPGFDRENVLTLRLSLGEGLVRDAGYDDGAADAVRSRFMIDLVARLGELPGVEAAGYTGDLPLDGDLRHDFVAVEGALPSDLAEATRALRVFIGPGYLEAIGAEIRSGRELEPLDFADQPRSVVVNRAFAEQRWSGEEAVGRRLLQYWPGVDPTDDVWYTVAGVVEDIREVSLVTPAEPTIYLPTAFLPEGGFGMPVSNFVAVLRTSGRPEALVPSVRETVRAFHPEIPITNVATLADLTARSFADVTFAMVLLLLAGSLSAVLGLVGVYGTVAYVAGQRTREFGLRVALGATNGDVRGEVLGRAARIGALGVGLGVVGALLGGRVLSSLLFEVRSVEPVVVGVVAAGAMVAVVAASLRPALRAAAVDPVEAMRAR